MKKTLFTDMTKLPLAVGQKIAYAAPGRFISVGTLTKLFFKEDGRRERHSISVKPYDGSRTYNIDGGFLDESEITFRVLVIDEATYKNIWISLEQDKLL